MVDETISEKCENLYNKLNAFVESEISRDVTPQISNLNSRINTLEPNLVRVKEVSGNISSISAGGTSTQTFTVPACPSGYNWEYLSTSTGWGTVSSVSLSGTTLTVTLLNVSNSSHDISFRGVLMYYPKTMEAEPHINLTATNPYLLEGEVTDLVVSLVDEFGLPLTNKNLTIGQSVFIDNGTTASHNDSWSVTNGTMTRMDNYTRLVESAQTLMCQMNNGYITPTSTVEFDFKAVDGVKNLGLINIRNSVGGTSLADLSLNDIGGDIGEWIHLKIVFNNTDTITIYSSKLDNPITKTLSSTDSKYRLLLYGGGANTELHFKNVIVYNNINGVTDENGEFALSDISVTDDTTFTATYSNVSDSVTIYYSQFADLTGDTSKYIYDSKCNVTSSNNEITVTWVSGAYNFWANKGDTSTEFDYAGDFTVEFDLLSNGNNANIQIYDNSATTYYSKSLYQLNGSNAGHFKIVKDGQVFKTFVDGVEKTAHQVNSNITGACRVGFRMNNTSTIKFRNFVIY